MVKIDLPGVNVIKKRLASGEVRLYYYHRATGTRLPDDAASPEFVTRVAQLNKQDRLPTSPKTGSVDDLVATYKKSPDYLELSVASRSDYTRYLEIIREKWGQFPASAIQRKHVFALRDKYSETPRKANYLIQVLGRLLAFGIDRGFRTDNPALRTKHLKTGPGHAAWVPEQITAYRKAHKPGTAMRTAFELGVGTGQRRGDIIKMTWADYDGSGIAVVQNKTQTKLWVPCPADLRAYLNSLKREGVLILLQDNRKEGFKTSHFTHSFHDAVIAAGVDGLTFHGLRYTAATALADAGCSARDIMSITGHKTEKMANKYAREANQKRRAQAAVAKLDGNENKT